MATGRSIDGFTRRAPLERPLRIDRTQLRYRPHATTNRAFVQPAVTQVAETVKSVTSMSATVQQLPPPKVLPATPPRTSRTLRPDVAPRLQPSRRPAPELTVPAALQISEKRSLIKRHGLVGMAVALFVLGLGVSLNTWHTNKTVLVQAQQQVNKTMRNDAELADENAAPATDRPSDKAVQSYQVAPDLPRYIRIGKISVFSRVRQMGLTTSGAIATPGNVHDAGWYMGSAKPGDAGATVIDGHVSSWQTNGVFHDLPKLVAGDVIEIERGDGKKIQYAVVSTKTFNAEEVDMASLMVSVKPGKSGLNLITCTGKVIKGTNDFDKRFVVYAVQK